MNTGSIILAAAGSLAVLTGSAFGVVQVADSRYAPMQAFADVQWTALKEAIREVRKDLEESPNDRDLQYQLDDLIDRLCRSFPSDRECS
jgi:hypothetical protein